jgi:hypothetical protein
VLVAVIYAWWATGVAPFTALSYVLVAIPSLVMVVSYAAMGMLSVHRADVTQYYRRRAGALAPSSMMPWLIVLVGAVSLEAAALALGGRSPSVPSLSTTVDHLLIDHWGRWVLYVAWLAVGARPLMRLRQRLHEVS